MVNYFWTVIITEFKSIFLNKSVFTVMIIGPLIYCFLYPQPYTEEVLSNITIGVVDQDNSTLSRELIRHVDATKEINTSVKLSSMLEAEKKLKSHDINGILLIPFDFEKNILKGESSPVSFYGDASYILIYNNAATALSNVTLDMNSHISIDRQIAQGVDASIAKSGSLPFSFNNIALFNPQSGYATYALPPVFILILHQLLFIGILLTTFSSQESTEKLIISSQKMIPLFVQTILFLVGKTVVYITIYLMMFIFYMIMLVNWYHIPNLTNYSNIIIFSLIFLLTTIAFAFTFSSLVKHIEDVFLLMIPISILLFFSSGISWPQELIPTVIIFIANLFPAVPSMVASVKLNQMGTPLYLIWPQIIHLIILASAYFAIAIGLFYRRFKRIKQKLIENLK